MVNSVVILVLGYAYRYVARWLNDMENHRTDVDYENSLVYKTLVISLIYASTSLCDLRRERYQLVW